MKALPARARSSYGMNYGVSNSWVGDEIPPIIEFEAQHK